MVLWPHVYALTAHRFNLDKPQGICVNEDVYFWLTTTTSRCV